MEKGVLYVACGEKYIQAAIESARYVQQQMDVSIGIVADQHPNSDIFDSVIITDDPAYSSVDKPNNLLESPFEKTLYLDCDVVMLDAVPELFELLDTYELLVSTDPNEAGKILNADDGSEELPPALPIFQTGVLAYRQTDTVNSLIEDWAKTASDSNYDYEQTAFRESMYAHDINWMTFTPLYNCLVKWPMQVTGNVKLIHGHLHDLSLTRIDDIEKRLNEDSGPRLLYYPRRSGLRAPTRPSLDLLLRQIPRVLSPVYAPILAVERIKASYERDGVVKTIKKGTELLSRQLNWIR